MAAKPAMLPRPTPARRAFTLIEAIATISILGAIGAVASSMVLSATAGWRDAAVAAQLHDELSTALERIAKELRAIPSDPVAPGPAPYISLLTASAMTYNATSGISLVGGDLRFIDDGAPAVTLLTGVSQFSIRAYDDDGAPLGATLSGTACRAIRRVEVGISLQRQGVTHTLRTRIHLRSTISGVSP